MCPREADVVQALFGRDALDDDLASHARGCDCCRDAMTVASALRADREWIRGDLPVPSAGQIWWRAAVRARLEATQAVARPLTWAHGVAAASAAGLVAGAAGLAWPTIARAGAFVVEQFSAVNPETLAVAGVAASAIQRSVPLAITVAAGLLLAPIAVYLMLTDE
jgi:hypothetical protein